MALLSVNVNKLATLRNARGGNLPDVIRCAQDILDYGAAGITVHPRPDERHIRKDDVRSLRKMLTTYNKEKGGLRELNIEGYPTRDLMELILETRPEQVTLVPDPPHVLTSNAGWNVAENLPFLKEVVRDIHKIGSRVSLFIDVFSWSEKETSALLSIHPERVELYTERYAKSFQTPEQNAVLSTYSQTARLLTEKGFGINAGHDLNLQNVSTLIRATPEILEVSIGHALIAEALYLGFHETIGRYLRALK